MDNTSLSKLEIALAMAEEHVRSELNVKGDITKEKGPLLNLLMALAAFTIQREQGILFAKEQRDRMK